MSQSDLRVEHVHRRIARGVHVWASHQHPSDIEPRHHRWAGVSIARGTRALEVEVSQGGGLRLPAIGASTFGPLPDHPARHRHVHLGALGLALDITLTD